jgi:hypothetical protein
MCFSLCDVYGAVTSRAQVPPTNVKSTEAISPTVLLITGAFASIAPVMVYSGLDADSVVPEGLITKVVEP